MEQSVNYLGLIPLFPLMGAVFIGLLHVFTCNRTKLPEKVYGILACVGPVLSFVLALKVFVALRELPAASRFLSHNAFTWFSVGDLHINMGFLADPLSCLMLLFVTFIGSLHPEEDLDNDILEGHLSAAIGHLGVISCRMGRPLTFDSAKEKFVNDKEADQLLTRKYREPFVVPEKV